jgi:hypothetical protein
VPWSVLIIANLFLVIPYMIATAVLTRRTRPEELERSIWIGGTIGAAIALVLSLAAGSGPVRTGQMLLCILSLTVGCAGYHRFGLSFKLAAQEPESGLEPKTESHDGEASDA